MGTDTMIHVHVPVLLTYKYKNSHTCYPCVSIYNIYFLPIAGFIHGYPHIQIFLTSLNTTQLMMPNYNNLLVSILLKENILYFSI